MDWDLEDTIAAIASASGGSARGIVRLGGPRTVDIVTRLFEREKGGPLPQGSTSSIEEGHVTLKALGRPMPVALFLWPGNRSYTGGPLAELHTLGCPPLLEALLEDVLSAGARLAEPGEFTLRAFLSGRIDLVRAEAVLGVIEATSRDQLSAALEQLGGGLSRRIHELRDALLNVLGDLEAGLDFAEEDLAFLSRDELLGRLAGVQLRVDELQGQVIDRTSTRSACRVVFVGRPNVGKSSLFNALVARSGVAAWRPAPALVSAQAGTTRDYLQARLALGPIEVELVDTAGARQADGAIEAHFQRVRDREQEAADLLLVCRETGRAPDAQEETRLAGFLGLPHLVVLTKADRSAGRAPESADPVQAITTSSVTGEGLDELARAIADRLRGESPHGVVAGTAARCGRSLDEAAVAVCRAIEGVHQGEAEELIALDVRLAMEQLGRVVGAVYTDDLLERIFSRFCIGK